VYNLPVTQYYKPKTITVIVPGFLWLRPSMVAYSSTKTDDWTLNVPTETMRFEQDGGKGA